eukprot:10558360-Alexandrium_andersonii.AAC.1
MSASLVGSEMCIRDRQRLPLVGLQDPRKAGGVRSCEAQGGPAEGSPRSCLLYTSDAADDM